MKNFHASLNAFPIHPNTPLKNSPTGPNVSAASFLNPSHHVAIPLMKSSNHLINPVLPVELPSSSLSGSVKNFHASLNAFPIHPNTPLKNSPTGPNVSAASFLNPSHHEAMLLIKSSNHLMNPVLPSSSPSSGSVKNFHASLNAVEIHEKTPLKKLASGSKIGSAHGTNVFSYQLPRESTTPLIHFTRPMFSRLTPLLPFPNKPSLMAFHILPILLGIFLIHSQILLMTFSTISMNRLLIRSVY